MFIDTGAINSSGGGSSNSAMEAADLLRPEPSGNPGSSPHRRRSRSTASPTPLKQAANGKTSQFATGTSAQCNLLMESLDLNKQQQQKQGVRCDSGANDLV